MNDENANSWTYNDAFERNIGLLTAAQQKTLKNSSVAVFGMGGLGGVIAEILIRCGIGCLKIADNGTFEPTNLNRQIFAFSHTIGKWKTDAAKEMLLGINPSACVQSFKEVGTANIGQIMTGVNVAVLAIDKIEPCLVISRASRQTKTALVEGWAIPYGNVRVYTDKTPALEEVYRLPSLGRPLETISAEEFKRMDAQLLMSLASLEDLGKFYPPGVVKEIVEKGRITSFAPMVWLTSVLMAMEVVKILLKWGKISYAPGYALYDPFEHRIPKQ